MSQSVDHSRRAVRFADRADAGRQLATRLAHFHDEPVVVLGIPRGGVPVAAVVARALDAPLEVVLVRKIGVPGNREVAMGAIGEGGLVCVDVAYAARQGVGSDALRAVIDRERESLAAQHERFRRGRERVPLLGKVAIIVDDGLATGATARVASRVARQLGAARVVVAVPVAPEESLRDLGADEVVCLSTPDPFIAVGLHYVDFWATSDEEVEALLADRQPGGGQE